MVDEHQVNSIIATAICDAQKDKPDKVIDPEQAKQLAKCIVEALTDRPAPRSCWWVLINIATLVAEC